MKEILYSFIIPHHNCPFLLNRCINSIPQREDIQIIVVDDNSEDDKKPFISDRSDVDIIYIDKNETKGAGHARNVALLKAKGKWLLFADADDFYKEDFIYVLDKYKDSSYDIVYLNFEYRDGVTLELLPDLPFKKSFDLYDGSQNLKDEIRFHHNVPWTKMIAKSYVDNHNIYFEEVPNGNDILFSMLSGYFTNNITVVKEPVYVYLRNINSISTALIKPTSFYLCKNAHRIKQNAFYTYIGYSIWKKSLIRLIIFNVRKSSIKLFIELFIVFPKLFYSRNEWINIVKSHEK